MGSWCGPLPSYQGSEVWALALSWVGKDSELRALTRDLWNLLWISRAPQMDPLTKACLSPETPQMALASLLSEAEDVTWDPNFAA